MHQLSFSGGARFTENYTPGPGQHQITDAGRFVVTYGMFVATENNRIQISGKFHHDFTQISTAIPFAQR
jgi:hypothetical protein